MKKYLKRFLSVLLVIAMLVPTGALTVQTSATIYGLDNSDWVLKGSSYYDSENKYYVLTPDSCWSRGGMWLKQKIDSDFVVSLDYYSGNRVDGGADGLAVEFYSDVNYNLSSKGDSMFEGNGFGCSIDTYPNYEYYEPTSENHVSINTDMWNHLSWALLPESEDDQWHNLKIIVVENMCNVYIDGVLKTSCKTEANGNGSFGITAETGADRNLHAVKNIIIKTEADVWAWDSEEDVTGEKTITGKLTGSSTDNRIAIDGAWYEYDTSVSGLAAAIDRFAINENITCKIKWGKIVACSKTEIRNSAVLSVNTSDNSIEYNLSTKKYNPENISLSINIANTVVSSQYGTINTEYVAGYDVTFDKLVIDVSEGDMLYFKDGWFGLGKTQKLEKEFDAPVTLKAGETFNFSEDLNAKISNDCKWDDSETKKDVRIFAYAYNGDTLVAMEEQTITFNNKTAEYSVKNRTELDKKIQNAASLLEKTTGVIYSPYLEELLTKDGLIEATNALKCKVALSSTILKAKQKESLEDKLIDKLMKKAGIDEDSIPYIYTTDINHSVLANTKEHGKFEVEFNISLSGINISNLNPVSWSFNTTYKIKGGKNIDKDKRTGSVISGFTYANISDFANAVEEVALDQIEAAYDCYGDDLNKVCEMFFDDTVTAILSKTKAESYSHVFYEMMTYPSKQVNIHCPVDVYVYDSDGVLCASVENNEITLTCDDIDIEVIGDEKYLTIYEGDYSIEIVATANNEMKITIEEYSSTNEMIRKTTFNNVALTPGDSFKTSVDENYLDSDYQILKNDEENINSDGNEDYIHYMKPVEIINKEATCTQNGEYYIECSECNYTVLTGIINATGHTDINHDGICDLCSEDITASCSHICHNDNSFVQFIWKIINFLYRIFGSNQYCDCGKAHW